MMRDYQLVNKFSFRQQKIFLDRSDDGDAFGRKPLNWVNDQNKLSLEKMHLRISLMPSFIALLDWGGGSRKFAYNVIALVSAISFISIIYNIFLNKNTGTGYYSSLVVIV